MWIRSWRSGRPRLPLVVISAGWVVGRGGRGGRGGGQGRILWEAPCARFCAITHALYFVSACWIRLPTMVTRRPPPASPPLSHLKTPLLPVTLNVPCVYADEDNAKVFPATLLLGRAIPMPRGTPQTGPVALASLAPPSPQASVRSARKLGTEHGRVRVLMIMPMPMPSCWSGGRTAEWRRVRRES
jgi:hypothetical protein